MTGKYLAELMNNSELKMAIAKHARRYSRLVEDQEEYIQEAWLRIAQQNECEDIVFYINESGKAIHSAWKRDYRNRVDIKNSKNVHGNSIREVKDPRKYVAVERGKHIVRNQVTLDSWYYDGEWDSWVIVKDSENWMLRQDAEHHEVYPFWTMDKSFSKTWRVNDIEVSQ